MNRRSFLKGLGSAAAAVGLVAREGLAIPNPDPAPLPIPKKEALEGRAPKSIDDPRWPVKNFRIRCVDFDERFPNVRRVETRMEIHGQNWTWHDLYDYRDHDNMRAILDWEPFRLTLSTVIARAVQSTRTVKLKSHTIWLRKRARKEIESAIASIDRIGPNPPPHKQVSDYLGHHPNSRLRKPKP
ncbi:MAG: twin-arginine translocation signal domain-containing protein [Gemmatimonadota bacterium]